jgi:hypothetical protein
MEFGIRLSATVRHCGKLLKERSVQAGVPLETIPIELHRSVDAETRSYAKDPNGILVIEGRYLDVVLFGIPWVKLLRLTCDEVTRQLRWETRRAISALAPESVLQRDQEDETIKYKLYGRRFTAMGDWMILNTSDRSPKELASIVLDRLHKEGSDD